MKQYFFLFFITLSIQAQLLPPIQSYSPDEYNAANQNWAITQSEEKDIFFANNDGLLKFKGKEVVQLYIRDRIASITRPVRELKGFEIIELEPGESKKVNFNISERLLRFYSANDLWEAEPGFFDIYIGSDSNANLHEFFELINF